MTTARETRLASWADRNMTLENGDAEYPKATAHLIDRLHLLLRKEWSTHAQHEFPYKELLMAGLWREVVATMEAEDVRRAGFAKAGRLVYAAEFEEEEEEDEDGDPYMRWGFWKVSNGDR